MPLSPQHESKVFRGDACCSLCAKYVLKFLFQSRKFVLQPIVFHSDWTVRYKPGSNKLAQDHHMLSRETSISHYFKQRSLLIDMTKKCCKVKKCNRDV